MWIFHGVAATHNHSTLIRSTDACAWPMWCGTVGRSHATLLGQLHCDTIVHEGMHALFTSVSIKKNKKHQQGREAHGLPHCHVHTCLSQRISHMCRPNCQPHRLFRSCHFPSHRLACSFSLGHYARLLRSSLLVLGCTPSHRHNAAHAIPETFRYTFCTLLSCTS